MTTTHREYPPVARRTPGMGSPLKLVLLMTAVIGGLHLLREHRSHVAGNWIVLLLACPLMHLFHGHGGRGGHGDDRPAPGPRRGKEG